MDCKHGARFIDLTGRKFGKLTVSAFHGHSGRRITWECVCECGKSVIARGESLRGGDTKSCGCLLNSPQRKDILGGVFGRLTVLSFSHTESKRAIWNCVCNCGAHCKVSGKKLISGGTKSCGCLQKEKAASHCRRISWKHGHSRLSEFSIWSGMISRCDPDSGHERYGKRGISVCDRWMSFEAFLSDMGPRPDGTSIDRINNDGNYEPGNCRWADHKTQTRNTSRNRVIQFRDHSATLAEWSEITGINYHTLCSRVDSGLTPEESLTKPVRRVGSRSLSSERFSRWIASLNEVEIETCRSRHTR